jgi:hypothetical protein
MKKDTSHRTAKFISSQQMESSETQNRAIKLGKILVKALDSQPGADLLSRWMAHYIAEKLVIAKKARGDAKVKAEQECFETILKLWEHRSHLPTGMRPYESFDPIFRALARLDPENKEPFFYRSDNFPGEDSHGEDTDDVLNWLSIARGIDQAARVWLDYVFHQAALSATDKNTMMWLENAVDNSRREETAIIIQLVGEGLDTVEDAGEQALRAKQESLKSRIEKLDAFENFNKLLRDAFIEELKSLEQNDSSKEDTLDEIKK